MYEPEYKTCAAVAVCVCDKHGKNVCTHARFFDILASTYGSGPYGPGPYGPGPLGPYSAPGAYKKHAPGAVCISNEWKVVKKMHWLVLSEWLVLCKFYHIPVNLNTF